MSVPITTINLANYAHLATTLALLAPTTPQLAASPATPLPAAPSKAPPMSALATLDTWTWEC